MNMTVDIYLVQTQNGHFLKAKNQNSVAVTCIFGIIIPVNYTIVYIKFNTAKNPECESVRDFYLLPLHYSLFT